MAKIIRKTYPKDFSFGVLFIIFSIVFLLAGQLFEDYQPNLGGIVNIYFADVLVGFAVLVMVLILWEEILFPVKIKPEDDGLIFRNHRTKLMIQVLIYLTIPIIIVFLYFTFEVNPIRFWIWAGACLSLPVVGKLISGINNYNDYLKLTDDFIEYKNNQKEGRFYLKEIENIVLIKDSSKVLHKLKLELNTTNNVLIDLDEMEIEVFYQAIDEYISHHYKELVK